MVGGSVVVVVVRGKASNSLLFEYARTRCTAVARSLTLNFWSRPCTYSLHELPMKVRTMQYSNTTNYCKSSHSMSSFDLTSLDCRTLPKGSQTNTKMAPRDVFQGDSGSGIWTDDTGWRLKDNSNALDGAKRGLVIHSI